jgi:hypothetical protein
MAAPFKDPRIVKVPVSFRLPQWMVTWMREQEESQSTLIEEALTEKHGIEPPKPKKK